MASQDGTDGRVYGGDCGLIHIADGTRAEFGRDVASYIDAEMRRRAFENGSRTASQAVAFELCPGCFMIAIFNAAVELADRNGQSRSELGRSLSEAFAKLTDGDALIEEIHVALDPETTVSVAA